MSDRNDERYSRDVCDLVAEELVLAIKEHFVLEEKMNNEPIEIKRVSECWGWINSHDKKLQSETFSSVSAAVAGMCSRLSIDTLEPMMMDRIYKLGFKLAAVQQTLTIQRILD